MLLLDLMAPWELKESIELLKRDLFDHMAKNGFADKKAIEMRRRLDIYIKRYKDLTEMKELEKLSS